MNQRFADALADDRRGGRHRLGAGLPAAARAARCCARLRPDLTIGFFNHIPFPPLGIYSQLPWRTQILEGLLGADVIGFQRARTTRATSPAPSATSRATRPRPDDRRARDDRRHRSRGHHVRRVVAKALPDLDRRRRASRTSRAKPEIQERAREIRAGLGNPKTVMLGVDRLDYTKGIRHRIKAFGELLEDGRLRVEDATLVQVASPSRERVETYKHAPRRDRADRRPHQRRLGTIEPPADLLPPPRLPARGDGRRSTWRPTSCSSPPCATA